MTTTDVLTPDDVPHARHHLAAARKAAGGDFVIQVRPSADALSDGLRWPMRWWPARSLSSLAAALPEPVAGPLRAVLTEQIPAPTPDDDVRARLADHYQRANGGLARLVASGPSSGRFGGWMP